MIYPSLKHLTVKDPELWRMALSFSDSALNVLLVHKSGIEPPAAASVPFAPECRSLDNALEEAVYANPPLLQPFDSVDIVAVTDRFHILPPEAAESADVADALDVIFDHDHAVAFPAPIDGRNSQLTLLPRQVARFLRRTFDRPRIQGHLAALGSYLTHRSRLGNSGKLYVNLSPDGRVDTLAFDSAGLAGANTFAAPDPDDAAYYILAMAQTAGLDLHADEIFVGGDAGRRGAVTPILSRYAAAVMPLILPQTARLPRGSETPLELAIFITQ